MKRMGDRFDKAVDIDENALTEYARKMVEERSDESRFCSVSKAGGGEFEVRDGHAFFPIRLDRLSCGCGKWQGTGIPCKHALRVIYDQRLDPNEFVSSFFKGAAYKLTYSDHIHPMPDSSQWPEFDLPIILPPPIKRAAGRPPKQRKRGRFDPKRGKRSSSVKCGKCKEVGHNSRTCKGGKTAKQRQASTSQSTQPTREAQNKDNNGKGKKRKDKQPQN